MMWSAIFILCMAAVLVAVRPTPLVWVAMVGNLIVATALRDSVLAVGVADVSSGALMLLGGAAMWPVGAIFAIMTICDVAAWGFAFDLDTTYAITEGLAYVQLFIIAGGLGGGTLRRVRPSLRPFVRRWPDPALRVEAMGARAGNPYLSVSE